MSDEIRHIENPPDIMWTENRSLLLTLRHARRVLRAEPGLAEDLLALAHADARQIIEDADLVIKAVRGNSPGLRKLVNALAESIEGELDADDDADEHGGLDNDQPQGAIAVTRGSEATPDACPWASTHQMDNEPRAARPAGHAAFLGCGKGPLAQG